MQRRRGGEYDKDCDEVAEHHADERILPDAFHLRTGLLRRCAEWLGVMPSFLLDLLCSLPEEKVGTDCRSENRDEASRECPRPLDVRDQYAADRLAPGNLNRQDN